MLMDIRIKGEMDGIGAAEEIHNRFGIPVIFSTAYLDQERIQRAKIVMPFGYVLKPIQERDLKVTLEMALYISKIDKERRLTEIRLKENEKKYRSLFNSINDGFCLHELVYDQTGKAIDYKVIDVNPRYEEILKIKKEDVINIIASIIYQSEIPPYLDVYTEVAETMKPCRFETFYLPMKKHFLISVFSYEKGKFVTVFQDITDRKNSEETLRDSEEKHRTLFETMTQGVVYQNAEGLITDANPAAEQILGLSLDQMQGRTSIDPRWKAIHEDGSDFPGETHPGMIALKTGKKVNNVIMGVFHPQKEEHRWININAVPKFREGESTPYENYATFDDITDLRKGKK
jgi:PAS domain S-box-containing protein